MAIKNYTSTVSVNQSMAEIQGALSPVAAVAKSAECIAKLWSAIGIPICEAVNDLTGIFRQIEDRWAWETALKAAEAVNSPLARRYHSTKKKRTRKKYAKKIMEWYRGD